MIYTKTELGRQALRERSDTMPRKFHFPFLMCDGVRDHSDILIAEARTGFTQADFDQMVRLGFIQPATNSVQAESVNNVPQQPLPSAAVTPQVLPTQQQANVFFDASMMATALSARLGVLGGFRMNLAVQAASNLADLDALLPQLQKALGAEAVKPLADLLKTASR
jgi:hypothetical protein